MDEPTPIPDSPVSHRCAVCGDVAAHGFGPPGFPPQPAEAWYCGTHRGEGERAWAARYRPKAAGQGRGSLSWPSQKAQSQPAFPQAASCAGGRGIDEMSRGDKRRCNSFSRPGAL
jgi:hypothetical protein